ncbi:Protein of unknown function [Marinococcus luteus]|uniref:Uncharacterized protein n=1 Tax=Marinococcus luteus TaxID=1122204 RepID=A0A1H2TFG1_9BACI|nr:DUF726 domain-containing protein [Marinococcus luteus]SDW42578.1 Protein of unknown function [Marinococcus luteus]
MSVLEKFGLDKRQTRLLFSLQRSLVMSDIEFEKNNTIKEKKEEWLQSWVKGVEDVLNGEEYHEWTLVEEEKQLIEECEIAVKNCENLRTPLYLILLELNLFVPYFPVDEIKFKTHERVKYDKKILNYNVVRYARLLDIDEEFIENTNKTFKKSVRSISKVGTKMLAGAGGGALLIALTAGLATPFIAGLAAPAGLAGAAATNAGLAAIGGGAVAAGGMGMAGGMTVIVGGGSIFGSLSGMALGGMLKDSSSLALREGAKLEVIMKEIILSEQHDVRFAQEMIGEQKKVIKKLNEELTDLEMNEKENKKQIKNLSKSIQYLKTTLKRSEHNLDEFV